MRVRLPLGRTLFFVCAFLFCLIALLPLRLALDWLALDQQGFAAREAKGSIWLGALSEAQFGPVALGDVNAELNPLPLFVGRARVDLERGDEAVPFKAAASISRHSFGLEDMTGTLDLAALFAPLPVASLNLDDVTARYADGLCASAEGLVTATVAGDLAGISLPGGLSGTARCDRGAVLLPLASQSGMEALNIHLFGNGRYTVEVAIQAAEPALVQQLIQSGFAVNPSGAYTFRVEGSF